MINTANKQLDDSHDFKDDYRHNIRIQTGGVQPPQLPIHERVANYKEVQNYEPKINSNPPITKLYVASSNNVLPLFQ